MESASERTKLCFGGLKMIEMIPDVVDLFGIALHWAPGGGVLMSLHERHSSIHTYVSSLGKQRVPQLNGAIHSFRPGHGM